MNKILIALVLAVVMSGNVYAANLEFKHTATASECFKAIEKGDLLQEAFVDGTSFLYYLYKNKIYRIVFDYYNYSNWMDCYSAEEE